MGKKYNDSMRMAIPEYDADDIAQLDMALFPGLNFNEKTIADTLRYGAGFVEYDGKGLAGYLIVCEDGPIRDIVRLGVRPDRQGCGVGTTLLQQVTSLGPSMLCVRKDNTRALELYRRLDFHIVGTLEDHWVMATSAG